MGVVRDVITRCGHSALLTSWKVLEPLLLALHLNFDRFEEQTVRAQADWTFKAKVRYKHWRAFAGRIGK